MFADVAGSTQLFEVLGDDQARTAIAETLELLTNVINGHNGTVIKTIGDEVMCTFPEPDDSANAATEMQETLEDANEMREEGPEIKIRIGMHFGPALLEGGDVFGDAVNVAARMAAQAKGGQIITTKTTIDLLDPVTQASSRFVDHAPIKGKKDVIEIYEIIWQESDVTTMATDVGKSQEQQDQVSLEVSYNKISVVVNQDKSGLMMGMGEDADEIQTVLDDLRKHNVDMLTLGQYLQPSKHHYPVKRYVEPKEFDQLGDYAKSIGFSHAACGPMVRSSYHADKQAAGEEVK